MTTEPRTAFSNQVYRSASCLLRPIEDHDAVEISTTLVSMEPWLTLGYEGSKFVTYLLRSDHSLNRYVITVSGKIAGIVCIRYPWLRGPYLELLAIWDVYQGRGLGREAMDWMDRRSHMVSDNMWTLASSFNERALRFYRYLGFVEVARLPDFIKAGYDEVLLRKKL